MTSFIVKYKRKKVYQYKEALFDIFEKKKDNLLLSSLIGVMLDVLHSKPPVRNTNSMGSFNEQLRQSNFW